MEKMLQLKNYILLGFLIAVISLRICNCRPVGFSYAKFSGPVSGPEKEIYVKDGHGRSYVDYIQKPDYSFAYGVDDPKTRVLQNRKETRHGDAVKGEYSVVDPDGTLRVVKYTADKKNGFQAEVITDGKSQMHGQDVSQHQPHQPQHQTSYYHHPNPQTIQHHQQPPPPPPPPAQHQEHNTPEHSYNDYDHYSHHEEQEPEYHQNVEAPVSAAYTSNTRHPPAPAPAPANTQYHQGGYSSGEQEEEDEYDDGGESGEDDDDDDESGEADDESGEDDY